MSAHEGSTWQTLQEAAAAIRRDRHTQQLIEDARGPVESPPLESEGPFDDKPTDLPTIGVSLSGEEAAAYLAFQASAKALAEHNSTGTAVMERYRAALTRLSAAAVK